VQTPWWVPVVGGVVLFVVIDLIVTRIIGRASK